MKTLKQAIFAAADWLEGNQERHIKGSAAINAKGFNVDPTDPEAECFCAIGRIGKELNIKFDDGDYSNFNAAFEPVDLNAQDFFYTNDGAKPWPGVIPFCPRENLSGPEAIENMRNIASRLSDNEPVDA